MDVDIPPASGRAALRCPRDTGTRRPAHPSSGWRRATPWNRPARRAPPQWRSWLPSCARCWTRESCGPALVFARCATRAHAPHTATEDLTAWERATNEIHLDGAVPVDIGPLEDDELVIGEADQVLVLRHGLGFALEDARLVRALP